MDDCKITPIGDIAVDLLSDRDAPIKDYIDRYIWIRTQCIGLTGLPRAAFLQQFNHSYMYGHDVRQKHTSSVMMYHIRNDLEKWESPRFSYLKKVLNLCFQSDICQKLNMSASELMGLDLPTLEFIEKEYKTYKPKEQDIIDRITKDMERANRQSKQS